MHNENIILWQVIDALREIEHAATHDMYDRTRVTAAIQDLGCYEAAAWLAANRHLYFKMLARARELNVRIAALAQPPATPPQERALAALVR